MSEAMERMLEDLMTVEEEIEKDTWIDEACIIIPTYNEADNIKGLLDLIFEHEKKQKGDAITLQVLVVDDSSPDGTADIVKKYRKKNKSVHLLLREEKEGLGAAYIAGMKHAVEKLDPGAVLEMDADFSHDPSDVFRLVQEIRNGADFVIGSRYVDGGEIPDDWGAHRKVISKCANLATRSILGIKGVADCSGGFRAIRTSLLKKIDLDSLGVKGYAFQAALLEAALYNGARVREVPISFSNRENGESKMSVGDVLEGFTSLARIRSRRIFGQDFTGADSQEAEAAA